MNVVLILLVSFVLVMDFARIKKNDKKVIYIYIFVTIFTLSVSIADKYDFFKASPFEMAIERMQPLTQWVETKFE